MKDDELSKLKNENEELRKRVLVLEDQLEDRDVHVVTQRFREGVDIGSSGGVNVGNDGCDGVMFCDVSPLRMLPQHGRSGHEGVVDSMAECRPGMLHGHYGSSSSATEVEGLTSDVECVVGLGYVNSYVRKIKNKVRRKRKMPEFDYPLLGGRTKKIVGNNCDGVDESKCDVHNAIIDVDTVVLLEKKWSGFDLNNRLGVWKMVTMDKKARITKAYERHGDGAVMWEDNMNGVVVYFSDVKNLIRQSCMRGNLRMYGNNELVDKSYCFSSVCLGVVKSNDVRSIENYIRKNVSAGYEFRFIHFPMCHLGHWTLVVYDTEDSSWKHYNPMRQRGNRTDVHYTEAVMLKERVSNVMMQSLRQFGLDEQSIEANFRHPLEAVTKCPQQKPET
ncbi:hypothetical protein CsSME_00017560 [Camellia sinensis var. sinensis]